MHLAKTAVLVWRIFIQDDCGLSHVERRYILINLVSSLELLVKFFGFLLFRGVLVGVHEVFITEACARVSFNHLGIVAASLLDVRVVAGDFLLVIWLFLIVRLLLFICHLIIINYIYNF